MDCPRCSVEMTELVSDDSVIQRCSDCGGVWADVADVNRFLLHANLQALSSLGGRINPDEIAGQCPACHVDLVAVEGGERRAMSYDTCESCGGIWVEGPEEGEIPETLDWKAVQDDLVKFYRRFARK
jgi:Zn-finger nucleic acid-binding protein